MSDNSIKIEVDGQEVEARPGQMLIEVTDRIGNYVPRFCYHDKLSIAANCRMCLVEVEKAPKPLPACATPVMDGMKVHTRSELALDAQKSVMEFLLINHPLDCPICDQGGECELQDLAMGYGRDVSRYQEKKRVVKDKNIGPLVQTDMTRCIHCTRCVRFGEEVAGLRELGATGRSEFMEIGTYIENSMTSELSGNVIDLCPVGALTSKPFRYSARTWEMSQHNGIAGHDPVGSNLHFHVKNDQVKRVVPAENEAVNEVWLSDRDRYSYEGLNSGERLTVPMVRDGNNWQEVDWDTAIKRAAGKLRDVIDRHGAGKIGALVSPSATSEEHYLAQKFMRGLGSHNIDHRLRQSDFSDQEAAPAYPGLGVSLAGVEQLDAVLVVGGFPRKDQPIFNHRLRKAALAGAQVMVINPVDFSFNFDVAAKSIVAPADTVHELAAVLKAAVAMSGRKTALTGLPPALRPRQLHKNIARALVDAERPAVFIGSLGISHPQLSLLRYLSGTLAQRVTGVFGYLEHGANSAGAWLAGAIPHRLPGMVNTASAGLDATAMLAQQMAAYVLLDVELELDCFDGNLAREAMAGAESVIAISGYKSAAEYADVLLPTAMYAENTGSYLNMEGRQQSFSAVVPPPGKARPAWEVISALAAKSGNSAIKYGSTAEIRSELDEITKNIRPDNTGAWRMPETIEATGDGVQRIGYIPMNSVDALVRHAPALQQTTDVADGFARINGKTARRLGVIRQESINVTCLENSLQMPLLIDNTIADNCVLIHGGHAGNAGLGPLSGQVSVTGT